MLDNFSSSLPSMGGGASGPVSKEFGRSSAEVNLVYSRGAAGASQWLPVAIAGGVLAFVALILRKR